MQLNHTTIHALFNEGAPNAPQRIALGVSFPLKKGWLTGLIGKEIEQAEYDRLMSLKGRRPKGVPASLWRAGEIEPNKDVRGSVRRKLKADCKAQFHLVLECLKVDEFVAAQDHAQAIVKLLTRPSPTTPQPAG